MTLLEVDQSLVTQDIGYALDIGTSQASLAPEERAASHLVASAVFSTRQMSHCVDQNVRKYRRQVGLRHPRTGYYPKH